MNDLTDPSRPSPQGPSDLEHAPPPVPDLPPVEAPSGAFIVQLFVIPAVVVFVVILVWLLFGKLAGGERDAMEYVRMIRESSANWRSANRAAYELASLIQNDAKLAADPRLLGELTDVLEHDLSKVENPELTQYLALALGRFQTLDAVTANGRKVDPLATLARALQGTSYPPPIRHAAATSLAQHAARVEGEGRLEGPDAVAALVDAGKTGEPSLRQLCVFALGFFGGEPATQALRERLGDDDRLTRYNAAVALARRGDPAALAVTREMLSTADLDKFLADAPASERQSRVETIQLQALGALQTAVDAGKPDLARDLRPELDALARSGLADVRNKAQALERLLGDAGSTQR